MEAPMRGFAWTAVAVVAIVAAPARAQTYAPGYPVCIQTYGITGNAIDCSFTSMDQCRASASGRAAQCISNPYFAAAPARRSGRSY
jgi:Protein of unknown function (DUF3551)